jgi:predicted Rossmann fold flavoprotein
MKILDTIIIGAGPAGLFASMFCSGSVLVLEKNYDPCMKLLLTGNGSCNLSHTGDIDHFSRKYGRHGDFLRRAFAFFSNNDTTEYFSKKGLKTTTLPDGRVFPASMNAYDVRKILIKESHGAGATLRYGSPVVLLESGEAFTVRTEKNRYISRSVLIATGGFSYPETGSTGDGCRLAASLGHRIVPPAPALTALVIEQHPLKNLSGITLHDAGIRIKRGSRRAAAVQGDILITHSGLSGPAVLDISRYVRPGDIAILDLAPHSPRATLHEMLSQTASPFTVKRTVIGSCRIAERVVEFILDQLGIGTKTTCSMLSKHKRFLLVERLKALSLCVKKPCGFNVAMATSGGVSLREIDPKSMSSLLIPGLYFAGEVIDIDGDTGGYNLQAAFSTAALAGRSIRISYGKNPRL